MNVYLIADTHFNHSNIKTYCDRPDDFTERIIRNWRRIVQPSDLVIHLGDVFIGSPAGWKEIYPQLTGRKILVRGNHDHHSVTWYMENGFDFACDRMEFRGCTLAHHPPFSGQPNRDRLWIHGHLHNIWHGFHAYGKGPEMEAWQTKRLRFPWQRLFAIEYTNYMPTNFDKFISHPDRYQARGPAERAKP